MSSYFDKISVAVRDLSKECPSTTEGTERFLFGLKEIEKALIKDCELFAGDVETPEDVRQAIITCIALNQVVYDGGDFLGGKIGNVQVPSYAAQYAAACRSSKLASDMHSLWHDIARMRYTMRYGLVSDHPAWAVERRDKWAEEHAKSSEPHPWQKNPPTAGQVPIKFNDYRPPQRK